MNIVIRKWRDQLECPEFWWWAGISVRDENIEELTKSNRILFVNTITLSLFDLTDLSSNIFMNFIANSENLAVRRLCLNDLNLSSVGVDVLTSAVVRLEEVKFCGTELTMNQLNGIFHKLVGPDKSKLKLLLVDDYDLSSVPPGIISVVVLGLEDVSLFNCNLSKDQLESTLRKIVETEDLRLRHLDLSWNELQSVGPSLLSAAIVKLVKVNLSWSGLTRHQLEEMFRQIVKTPDLTLAQLDISSNDLSSTDPDILAKAVMRLEGVSFYGQGLTPDQVNSIITALARSESIRLKRPHFKGFDFSLVPSGVVAEALVKLRDVDLSVAHNISKYQVNSIMERIATCEGLVLQILDISGLDLSLVPPMILSKAILRLEEIYFYNETLLTDDQVMSLFSHIADSKELRLRTLHLDDNDLSLLPAELISDALVRLERVSLTGSHLQPDQVQAIFNKIVESDEMRLEDLELLGQNCESLSPQCISRANLRLNILELDECWLPENKDIAHSNTSSCSCSNN